MKEQKISTSMSLSGNYYEIKKNQTKKNNPVKFFLDFVFRFRTGIVSAACLLHSIMAVIGSPILLPTEQSVINHQTLHPFRAAFNKHLFKQSSNLH